MRKELDRLQEDLLRVPGVRGARVVGERAPLEIHIVAEPDRPAKQVVRDVQSLAAARYGIPIDRRIVSIVQLEEPVPPPPPPAGEEEVPGAADVAAVRPRARPKIERVVMAAAGDSGWVKVVLTWPDGRTTEGADRVGLSRESRARGAAAALVKALDPMLDPMPARIDVEHLVVDKLGEGDSVTVRALFSGDSSTARLVGTALVKDDVATAAVHALLHAVNRKLEIST